jgi:phosphate transport system ATP-binding protein
MEEKFEIEELNIWFGPAHALKDVEMEIYPNEILSIIGPANSGKTTFIRMLNRMNDLQPHFRMSGEVEFDDEDINKIDIELLRKKVGMVFALPLPLPLSIFENVAYGARMYGIKNKKKLEEIVKELK